MPVRIIAEPTIGWDIKPGDLFSTADQKYWDAAMKSGSLGECVYVRSDEPAHRFPDAEITVYRITITTEDQNGTDT